MKTVGPIAMKGVIIMIGRVVHVSCLLVAVLALSSGVSLALQTTLSVDQSAVITNPSVESEKRVLVQYEVPDFLSSSEILYAQLRAYVDATLDRQQAALEVEAVPVHTEWTAGNVSWTSPWNTPGGDTDTHFRRTFLVGEGRQQVRIDVTDLVRQWAAGDRVNLGVLVRASDSFGGTFCLPAEGAGFQAPLIRVWYLPATD